MRLLPGCPQRGAAEELLLVAYRFLATSGKGEDPWSIFSILINGLGSLAKAWNYEGEQLLRACKDIDYTIVRYFAAPGRQVDSGWDHSRSA